MSPVPTGPAVWSSELSRSRARGHRALLVGVTLLVLGGGAMGGWWWLGSPAPQPTASAAADAPSLDRHAYTSDGRPVAIGVRNATTIEVIRAPADGKAAVRDQTVTYTPKASHVGADSVGLRACNEAGCTDLAAKVRTGRPGLSALSSVDTVGVVRRADQPLAPGTTITGTLPAEVAAVAVSVTVHGGARPGAVTLDGGAGRVAAVRTRRAGATTTNVVVVPVRGTELVVTDGAGGGLTVDIVGTFAPATQARAGRFVRVDRTRVAELDTARDGRRATIGAERYGATPGIRAALVLVTAEIGTQTAWVDFGRSSRRVDRSMIWGAGPGGKQRRAVALVPVDAEGRFSLDYQHGSRITVDVLGYFTGQDAPADVSGLYVPRSPATIFDAVARSGGREVEAPAAAGSVVVALAGQGQTSGDLDPFDVGIAANRTLGSVLPAARGRVEIRAQQPLEVRVDLLGYFVR